MLRFLRQTILFIIEFCFKLTASLAALISLGARGGLFQKVLEGFQSLPEAIRQIIWWVKNIPKISIIIDDYNTLTAATFNQKYGSGAVNYVMNYLSGGIDYLQRVYLNLADDPIITIAAGLIIFLIFYLIAWGVRFTRQEGQGSFITKFERRTGNRIFKNQSQPHPSSESPNT